MRAGRSLWLIVILLFFCVTSCDNRDPLAPIAARQTRDPSGVSARPLNSSSVQVNWNDSSTNETGFRIERSASATGPWTLAGTTGSNVTLFADGARSSEQQVCYRVFAILPKGLSNPANSNCTVPPAGGSGLTAAVVDHQTIDLSWTDNSAAEQGYEIERATAAAGPFATVAWLQPNTAKYRQSGLTTNTTYWYRVRPNRDGGYGDYSNVATETPVFRPPAAPSNVSAQPMGGTTVLISWVDNATNETGFYVERSLDQGATWTIFFNDGSPNSNRQYDYNAELERQVCYRVLAYSGEGASAPSNVDCTAIPAAPSGLAATPVNQPPAIDLTWTDNSGVEDGYEVWRSDETLHLVAQLPANAVTYHDAGVNVDQQYSYIVRATKDGVVSDWSGGASAVVVTTVPPAPSGTHAQPGLSSTTVIVSWNPPVTNEQGYRIERSTNGGASWDIVGVVVDDMVYRDGVLPEAEVCYRVIAFNALGDSPPSNVSCTAPPAGATNLTATWTDQGVVLNWTDNSNVEDAYDIFLLYPGCEEPGNQIASLPPNTTTYDLGTVSWWTCGWGFGDYPVVYVVVSNDGGGGDLSNGVYLAPPGASGSSASIAPPASASITRGRVKP